MARPSIYNKTKEYILQWIDNTRGYHSFGYMNIPVDTMASYIGISNRSLQKHLATMVRSGLIYKIDVIGKPSVYIDKQPSEPLEAVYAIFQWYTIPEGYNGHMINFYGSGSVFYQPSDVYEAYSKLILDLDEYEALF